MHAFPAAPPAAGQSAAPPCLDVRCALYRTLHSALAPAAQHPLKARAPALSRALPPRQSSPRAPPRTRRPWSRPWARLAAGGQRRGVRLRHTRSRRELGGGRVRAVPHSARRRAAAAPVPPVRSASEAFSSCRPVRMSSTKREMEAMMAPAKVVRALALSVPATAFVVLTRAAGRLLFKERSLTRHIVESVEIQKCGARVLFCLVGGQGAHGTRGSMAGLSNACIAMAAWAACTRGALTIIRISRGASRPMRPAPGGAKGQPGRRACSCVDAPRRAREPAPVRKVCTVPAIVSPATTSTMRKSYETIHLWRSVRSVGRRPASHAARARPPRPARRWLTTGRRRTSRSPQAPDSPPHPPW